MLAATASHLSPSDMGRRCNKENTKGGSKLESWRVRKGEGSKEANVPRVYGGSMPPEWKLQRLYKRLKTDNTNFTTWLVESVHPTIESLPPYITLSRKQAKGKHATDPAITSNPAYTNVNRLRKIRHHRQQHDRACTPNAKRSARYGCSPRPPYRRTDRILILDGSEIHGRHIQIQQRKPRLLYQSPERAEDHPSGAYGSRSNDSSTSPKTPILLKDHHHTISAQHQNTRQAQNLLRISPRPGPKKSRQDRIHAINTGAYPEKRSQRISSSTKAAATTTRRMATSGRFQLLQDE